ncbi:PKD domain-containing protein [Kibdelosporangium philippinense]|uniref:PKD domain-containing protein n=1 Tax=Kibdelosporangium philippinense TaxID=211113 RepID=A0ABS8ZU44_9PSEU|nr:PKD domain-containing protein [Kibdelosporangium philippinense]MCE7011219.1 PKD domain-containing protein [Kibdelosporangium philippinense]
MTPLSLRKPWIRNGFATGCAVAVLGGVAVAGMDSGHEVQNVKLLSGAAWLPSGRVGQLSLLDGTSAEVSAQVQVSQPGSVLEVVQAGPNAYSVDQTAGTIRRIDGATFEVSAPEAPIGGARSGLTAFAGSGKLYIVDTQRGLFTNADPRTGRALSTPQTLATQIAPNTTGIDTDGRLWISDNATGDVRTIIDGEEQVPIKEVTRPGRSVLTMVNGRPLVVEVAARKATTVDPSLRKVDTTIDIDLRDGEDIQLSGSPYSDRFYVVAPRGVLTICSLAEESCSDAVPLASGKLGAAVEAGNHLFVPDYTTGQVWIVGLDKKTVLAQPKVVKTARQFQLVSRDNMVFFNVPDTDEAGVITVEGAVLDVAKYDKNDPNKGLNAPITGVPTQPNPPQQPSQQPDASQVPVPPQQPSTEAPPVPPTVQPPPPPPPPPPVSQPEPAPPPDDPPPTQEKPVIKITSSKTSPVVAENITLKVDDSKGTAPTHATWSFGDGQNGNGAMVGHKWATIGTYQVSVQVTMPDGQQAMTSRPIEVTKQPDTTVPSVIGQTQNAATTALTNANLRSTVAHVASHTVAAGLVVSQNPVGGKVVAPQTMVTLQVSSGKPAVIDLRARAASATWTSGAGTLPYNGSDVDERGFVKPRTGYQVEDGSYPALLETHPQWVANGFIQGTFTLSRPVIAGDRFRATVGFMSVQGGSAGSGTFIVSIIKGGAATTIATVNDSASDGVMRPINVDLTPHAGATGIRFRFNAGASAGQDWASWVGPRIEG